MHIRIGTRGSRLALAQAKEVVERLRQKYMEDTFEIIVIKTHGDKILDRPLQELKDKGIFVKEIEQQLLNGTIDIGVHSMKDMPSKQPAGLILTKTWKREDRRDVLIAKHALSFADLPAHAVLASGSRRRSLQIKRMRPDIEVVGIRGNVDTRLQKMQDNDIDALIMAAAGFHRLGLQHLITQYFSVEDMVPACAQGALALEIREDDMILREKLDALQDTEDTVCTVAERLFLSEVNGSCHIPVGACCQKEIEGYRMTALLGKEEEDLLFQRTIYGKDPKNMAKELAHTLLKEVRHG